MTDNIHQPIPVQDLPENQDPSVAFILDEVTGTKTPLPGGPLDTEKKSAKRAAKKTAKAPKEPKVEEPPAEEGIELDSLTDEELLEAYLTNVDPDPAELPDRDGLIAALEALDSEPEA